MIEHFNLQSKVFVDLDQMIIIEEGGNAVSFFCYRCRIPRFRSISGSGWSRSYSSWGSRTRRLNPSRVTPPGASPSPA